MADISQSLKDYMSKSQSKEPLLGDESSSGGFSFGKLNPFKKSESKANDDPNEVANSWFSQAQKDPLCPGLTKKQRILGFVVCLLMGTFCFCLACLYIPILVLKARKFAMLYTVGSLFIICSFSMLWGPMNHIKHLLAAERLPFTSVYFGTMFATIYFSIWVKSTVFTVIFAVIQILALVWYIMSYIPGGQTGMKFFSRIFYAAASKTTQNILPV
ncbi:uncharacterized protein LOC132724852 [Ruditapes philippinarum]|uniref:uncharacterized protein LOC132724852 n=1 Tax=Ruditapes philippinarum TaxID=129788 RepID=UPI00295AB6CA|nr:uncharacterized protein LOC132724852 [Ruditapes philippinarum]